MKLVTHEQVATVVLTTFYLLCCFQRKTEVHGAKTLTFCNISVIIEEIYLKLGVCVHNPTSNTYCQGRLFKMPLFQPRLFILYQAPDSGALASECGALVSPCILDCSTVTLRVHKGNGHLQSSLFWSQYLMLVPDFSVLNGTLW